MKSLLVFLLASSFAFGQGILSGVVVSHGTASGSTVATPTDSPGAGSYSGTQSVTLSDSTSGSTICYTTDGSTPGASTPGTCNSSPTTTYSGAISVASTTTIKAIGTKSGLTNSGVLTSVYTISSPAFVNATSKIGSAATTLTTNSFAATAGGLIVVTVGYQSAGGGCTGNTFTVTDSESNTYSLVTSSQVDNAFLCSAMYYKASVPGNASETITVNVSPGETISGIATVHLTGVSVLDQHATGSNTSSTTDNVSTGSITPTSSASIAVGSVLEYWITDTTIAAGTGFTIPTNGSVTGGMKMAIEYQILSSTSAITPSFSITGTGNYNYSNMQAANFK